MAYKYTRGSTVQGDIKAQPDPERNTAIDFEDDYIGLKTSGSTILVVSGSKVGIGTTSPDNTFHAYSTDTIGFKFEGDDHCIVKIDGSNGSEKTIRFTENGALRWMVGMDNSPDSHDNFFSIKTTNNDTSPEILIDNTNGNIGLGTGTPTEKLDINSDAIRIRSSQTPSSATAVGDTGQICWDTNYLYICVSGGTEGNATWKRIALSTW